NVSCTGSLGNTGILAANPVCIANGGTSYLSGTVGVSSPTTVYLSAPSGGTVSPTALTASPGASIQATYTAPATGTGTATVVVGSSPGASNFGTVSIQVGQVGCT